VDHLSRVSSLAVSLLILSLAVVSGVMVYGQRRWEINTRALRERMTAAREPVGSATVKIGNLAETPEPVRRYLETALAERQRVVTRVHLEHHGEFNIGQTRDKWKPFTSDQLVVIKPPGFDWNARVSMIPGATVRIHDAYVGGKGILLAALHGLLPLVRLQGGGELAQGELMRFLAEAAWYPTALVPSHRLRWSAVDSRSARATLQHDSVSADLLFKFGDDGLIESVSTDARGRMVRGAFEPTPWQGQFWNYVERDGMQIPLDGEVAWMLPEGPRPYWRGHLREIKYDYFS
jgi:hypothetical protein